MPDQREPTEAEILEVQEQAEVVNDAVVEAVIATDCKLHASIIGVGGALASLVAQDGAVSGDYELAIEDAIEVVRSQYDLILAKHREELDRTMGPASGYDPTKPPGAQH